MSGVIAHGEQAFVPRLDQQACVARSFPKSLDGTHARYELDVTAEAFDAVG